MGGQDIPGHDDGSESATVQVGMKRMDQADRASWIDELRRRISPKSRLEPEKMLSTIQSLKKLVEPVASEPIDLPKWPVKGNGSTVN